jgi:hypothetical protein
MDIGGSTSAPSAILGRSVADRGVFVWSLLIVTMVSLVLADCTNQTAGVPSPSSVGQAAAPGSQPSYPAPMSTVQQDYSDSLPYPKQSLTCFAAQRKRKPRVKRKLCRIRLAPTHLPASLTHQLRASNRMARPRRLRPPPPRRPPIRIPRTHCRIPNNR